MPGISGLARHIEPLDDPERARRVILRSHALKNVDFVQRSFLSAHCVIVNLLTGLVESTCDQPGTDRKGNALLFLEGDIFNGREMARLARDGGGDVSLCHLLASLFVENRSDLLEAVNGHFNIVVYEKIERRLTIVADHLASKPMYYLREEDCLYFGSEKRSILALTRARPAIDPVGLLQPFAHLHNLGDRTYIEGLKRLPPATILTWEGGELTVEPYERLHFEIPDHLPPTSSLIDRWCALLRKATARQVRNGRRLVLSLSGGLDSRSIACAIGPDRRPVWARTRGVEGSFEVLYAAEIARRLGFHHMREDPYDVPLSRLIPKIIWRTEGEIPFKNGLSLAHHRTIKERGDFMIGGWLGDAGSGAHIAPYMLLPGSREAFVEWAYRGYLRYTTAQLSDIFTQDFLRETFPRLYGDFRASYDAFAGQGNVDAFQLWDLYHRQTRMTIGSMPVDSHLFEKVIPFLDRDYLAFLMTLPLRFRFGQVLYQAMIHHLGPPIRDIPNANNLLTVRGSVLGNYLNTAMVLGRKAGSRLARRSTPGYRDRVERGAREDLAAEIRRDTRILRFVEDYVGSSDFDPGIFDREGIHRLLDRHYRGLADHSDLVVLLVSFAFALSYFVHNKPWYCPPEAEPC